MSIHEEIRNRVQQLRRKDWKWVKYSPHSLHEMCAVLDHHPSRGVSGYRLSDKTVAHLNHFVADWSDGKWTTMIDYNDSPNGARSVDDVIEVLEKFAAELQ